MLIYEDPLLSNLHKAAICRYTKGGSLMKVQLYTCKFLANYKTLERTRWNQPLHSYP